MIDSFILPQPTRCRECIRLRAHNYINAFKDGLILDCGAGNRRMVYETS